jgi:hypothetical protein
MRTRRNTSLLRFGALVAFALALGACTKGGQFDPTTLLDNDMFDSKKPLKGEREPVFPNGVPGVQSGIPADLYKGYQPPPEQAADNGNVAGAAAAPPEPEPVKPKPKPRPKVATTAPPAARPEISVGLGKQKPPQQQPAQGGAQSPWPNPAPPPAAQTAWPAAPSAPAQQPAQGAQSPWPTPPPTGQAQQTGQSSQSIWPNPPATSSH